MTLFHPLASPREQFLDRPSPFTWAKAVSIDLERVLEVDQLCLNESVHYLEDAKYRINGDTIQTNIWVVRVDRDIQGFIDIRPHQNCWAIAAVAIDPNYQDRNLGRFLVEKGIRQIATESRSTGLPNSIKAVTSPHNSRMLRVLLTNGFVGTRIVHEKSKGDERVLCVKGSSTPQINTNFVDTTDVNLMRSHLSEGHSLVEVVLKGGETLYRLRTAQDAKK